MDGSTGGTTFRASVIENHEAQALDTRWWVGYESVLQPSAIRRDTVEVRLRRDHLTISMPAYKLVWYDGPIPALDWDDAVVQFGHHSYNPTKDDAGVPNTWHWDNMVVEPARPFNIIRARERAGERFTFEQEAPAGSRLRFRGDGDIELSVDGGQTWQLAQRQVQELSDPYHAGSGWHPVPEGTREVMVRGSGEMRDVALWSRDSTTIATGPVSRTRVHIPLVEK